MPSPFPGMDPYIEEPSMWPGMHISLMMYTCEALQPKLEPKYIARVGERIKIADTNKGYIPDAMIVEPHGEVPAGQVSDGTLVADEPTIVSFLDEEAPVPYLEIIYRETGDVVTVLELLSPSNKVGVERTKYIKKQAEVLDTHANLVEIDLLGYGPKTTLARDVVIAKPADWRYMICISRANRRNQLEIYPVPLRQRLPRCRIPLRAADPDVVLDLPTIFNRCYDVGRYDAVIDYAKPPSVTLSQEETKWVDEHLITSGLRPS